MTRRLLSSSSPSNNLCRRLNNKTYPLEEPPDTALEEPDSNDDVWYLDEVSNITESNTKRQKQIAKLRERLSLRHIINDLTA